MLGLGASITNSSVQWRPTSTAADLKLWLQPGITNFTVESSNVSQWSDSSSNENHVTQGVAGNRAGLHAFPTGDLYRWGIDFEHDNGDHYDLTSSIDIASDEAFMAFFVVELESASSEGLLGESNNAFIDINTTKKIKFKTTGTGGANTIPAFTGTPFATGAKFVLGIQREAGTTGNLHIYKNGDLLTPDSQLANRGDIAIDTLGTKDAAANSFDGAMWEVLVYDTVDLTALEIAKVCAYLKNKHNL